LSGKRTVEGLVNVLLQVHKRLEQPPRGSDEELRAIQVSLNPAGWK
jgi:hypothetical protein